MKRLGDYTQCSYVAKQNSILLESNIANYMVSILKKWKSRIFLTPNGVLIQSKCIIWNDAIKYKQTKVVKFSSEHFLAMCINESLRSEIEAKIRKLGGKCKEVEAWLTAKYLKTHFSYSHIVGFQIRKMGRRSINTTKSGKFMNPTDQASKFKQTWLSQNVYCNTIPFLQIK